MGGQGNAALDRSAGAPGRPGEAVGSEDSSILRYIKTLTSHQTNAKQQRLDRYLQQVKHAPESKPLQIPAKAAISLRQDSTKTLKLPVGAALKAAPGQQKREAQVKEGRSTKEGLAERKNEGRAGTKRRQEGGERNYQRKKPKRATAANKKTTVGSLDRFRLNGTWSLEKRQAGENRDVGNMVRLAVKVHAASKVSQDTFQHGAMSLAPSQQAAANPRTSKPLSTSAAAAELREAELPFKQFNTVRSIPAAKGPWGKSTRADKDLSVCTKQQEDLEATLTADQDFAAVYDPLNFLMESIYF